MAARLRLKHQDEVRAKIQASQLVNALQNHVTGTNNMSSTQVRAAEILLRKAMPDLTHMSGGLEFEGALEITHKIG